MHVPMIHGLLFGASLTGCALRRIMVGLYISCVVIGKSDEIPNNEIAFYVFGLVSFQDSGS